MAARPRRIEVGQLVYIPVDVKPGMFPTEMRFYGNVMDKTIAGYVQTKQLAGDNKLMAVVIGVSNKIATIALSGEAAQSKVLEVPFDFIWKHAHL
jgi:hypothetical protein